MFLYLLALSVPMPHSQLDPSHIFLINATIKLEHKSMVKLWLVGISVHRCSLEALVGQAGTRRVNNRHLDVGVYRASRSGTTLKIFAANN